MRFHQVTVAVVAASLLAACAGRSSVLPGVPAAGQFSNVEPSISHGPADVVVSIDLPNGALPNFTQAFDGYAPRGAQHTVRAGAPVQYLVNGYLYEGYLGTSVIANTITITKPSKGTIKANMPFSPVPTGNNLWALLEFYLPESNGSNLYVGSMATFVNHKKGPTAGVHVDPQSTLVFQALMALINAGFVDADDLKTNTKLTNYVATAIKGLKPSPSTGLFTPQTIEQFVSQQAPKWRRTLTIDAGSTAQVISVTSNIQNLLENNLAANTANFLASGVGAGERPNGAPCAGAVPLHQPGTHPTPPPTICTSVYGTSTGSLTLPVYGNDVFVGASNGVAPFKGITQAVGARPAGSSVKVKLPALRATQISVATNDPFDWAFGTTPSLQVNALVGPSNVPFKVNGSFYPGWDFGKNAPVQFAVPSNYSKAHSAIAVNSWNPFGLPASAFNFCTAWNSCRSLDAKGTFNVSPPFADPGTNSKYYKWKGSSGTKIAAVKGCPGYTITPKAGKAAVSTVLSSFLLTNQVLEFQFAHSATNCGNIPSVGTTVSVRAISAAGVPFSGSGISTPAFPTLVNVTMNTYQNTPIKSLTFVIDAPKGGSTPLNLGTIRSIYTP